jgi:hypothetical protein
VKRHLALLLVATAAPAVAQPVTQPEHAPCAVEIVHAPAAVRATIESWVRAEPRCNKHLEVRVVPTAGGFYLLARDDQGQVRERVVPDAQSVAVLVVSWAADDSLPSPIPATPVEIAPPARHAPLRQLDDSPELDLHAGPRTRQGAHHALMLGGITAPDGALGARGQLDVLALGDWTLGFSGAWLPGDHDAPRADMSTLRSSSRLGVYVGRSVELGPLELRAQLGAGAAIEARALMAGGDTTAVRPFGEASLLVTVPLGSRVGLVAGPVVDVEPPHDDVSALNASLFFGLRIGL